MKDLNEYPSRYPLGDFEALVRLVDEHTSHGTFDVFKCAVSGSIDLVQLTIPLLPRGDPTGCLGARYPQARLHRAVSPRFPAAEMDKTPVTGDITTNARDAAAPSFKGRASGGNAHFGMGRLIDGPWAGTANRARH